MDLDTTIKGLTLTRDSANGIFEEICEVWVADNVKFELMDISDIREGDDYPGLRVSLKATYPPIAVPLTVDVTTGDVITPKEIEYSFPLLFDGRAINVLAYNLETVLAEKIETVLSRGVANTRLRDFYDIHILYTLHGAECNKETLSLALMKTVDKRGSHQALGVYAETIAEIRADARLRASWENYRRDFDYAKGISFDDVCKTIQNIMNGIVGQTKTIG